MHDWVQLHANATCIPVIMICRVKQLLVGWWRQNPVRYLYMHYTCGGARFLSAINRPEKSAEPPRITRRASRSGLGATPLALLLLAPPAPRFYCVGDRYVHRRASLSVAFAATSVPIDGTRRGAGGRPAHGAGSDGRRVGRCASLGHRSGRGFRRRRLGCLRQGRRWVSRKPRIKKSAGERRWSAGGPSVHGSRGPHPSSARPATTQQQAQIGFRRMTGRVRPPNGPGAAELLSNVSGVKTGK